MTTQHPECERRHTSGEAVPEAIASPVKPALSAWFGSALILTLALFFTGSAIAVERSAGSVSSEEGSGAAAEEGASPAAETAPAPSIMPQITLPRFELPGTKLPEVEGLRRPTTEREEMPERAEPVDVGFSVVSIHHARSHRGSARGCVPQNRLEGFRVQSLPSQIQAFTSCIRFSAERAVVARFQAQILDPNGREVADADGEISFAGEGKTIDYVISWAGFPARTAGTYEIVLTLERREVGRFPLEVTAQ